MNCRIMLAVFAVTAVAVNTKTKADHPSFFELAENAGESQFQLLGFQQVAGNENARIQALVPGIQQTLPITENQIPALENLSDSSWDFGGWLATGYHNKSLPLSRTRGDGRSFNDVPGNFNVNQLWFYAERKLRSDSDFDWGIRADFVYGTDAQKTQAFGGTGWDNSFDNGVYGWAIPQLYVELSSGDYSVKAGHFFTLIGYEVVATPDNFFYSRSLTMFNSEPFTHSGVLTTYNANDSLTLHGGWVAGWDTAFESNDGGSMFLGGFSKDINDDVNFSYFTTIGNTGVRGSNAYSHSMVMSVDLSENLQYVAQSDFLSIESTSEDDIGFNQYLFYDVNDKWRWGNRVEWWKNDGVSFWEFTSGLNFFPRENTILRTEIRYDRGPTTFDQTTYGLDAILKF